MVSQWSLSDSKSSQVSLALLSGLADLINAVVWMASTRTLISKPSCPFCGCTKSTNYNFMFHSFFFSSQARSSYLSFFSISFNFTLWSAGKAKCTIRQILFFFFWRSQNLFVWQRIGDPLVSENTRKFCSSHSPGQILGCEFNICVYGRILISCTIPSGSNSYPVVSCLIFFMH